MGFWKSGRGINGDSWADRFDGMMKDLEKDVVTGSKTYEGEVHEITMGELADLVEFCSRGHLIVTVHDDADSNQPLSRLHDTGEETYGNSGQMVALAND